MKHTLNLFKKMCTIAQEINEAGLGEIFITAIIKAPEESTEESTHLACKTMCINNLKGG